MVFHPFFASILTISDKAILFEYFLSCKDYFKFRLHVDIFK